MLYNFKRKEVISSDVFVNKNYTNFLIKPEDLDLLAVVWNEEVDVTDLMLMN